MFDDIIGSYNVKKDDKSIKNFLLRWKRDIEEGFDQPLEYDEIEILNEIFGNNLIEEISIAYAGWEAVDDPYVDPKNK